MPNRLLVIESTPDRGSEGIVSGCVLAGMAASMDCKA